MQAIAFENFSKMFLRSILMTPDLLPIATFVKKKTEYRKELDRSKARQPPANMTTRIFTGKQEN